MRSALKFLLPGVFLLFLVKGNAQMLTITRDYNACLYGLTDSPGHWVVPAKYVDIRPFESGFAIVMAGSKYGLINSKGVEVLPLIYDQLKVYTNIKHTNYYLDRYSMQVHSQTSSDRSQRLLYCARIKKFVGIIDTLGKEIIPIHNLFLSDYLVNGVSVFASDTGRGFLDLNGIRGIMPKEFAGIIRQDLFLRDGLYIVSKSAVTKNKYYSLQYGVYNDSARLIVPCEYDSINYYMGYQGIIEVYKNGKTGYYRRDGKKLFEPIYIIAGARERKASPLAADGHTFAFDGKYWGILKIDGTFLLDLKYEELVPFPKAYPGDPGGPAFKIKENGKWGIISNDGQWILPATWTSIYNKSWKRSQNPAVYIFNVRSEDHWGAISTTGQEEMPFIYDTIFPLNDGLIFWSEEQADLFSVRYEHSAVLIYDYDPVKDSANPRYKHWKDNPDAHYYVSDDMPMSKTDYDDFWNPDENNPHYKYGKYFSSVDQTSVSYLLKKETGDPDYFLYTYAQPTRSHWNYTDSYYYEDEGEGPAYTDFSILIHRTKNNVIVNCNLSPLTEDSLYTYYSFDPEHSGIIRSDGKVILEQGRFKNIERAKFGYFTVINSKGPHMGMINLDGKLVVDTAWDQIIPISPDTVWVKLSQTNVADCNGEWNIVPVKTGKPIWKKEDQLVSWNDNGPLATSKGVGLFDKATLSFMLPPVYKKIYQTCYPSDKFVVENCAGKIGIVNSKGIWETDSCWTSIFRVSHVEEYGQNSAGQRTVMSRQQHVLLNDTAWILYDNKGTFEKGTHDLAIRLFEMTQLQAKTRDCAGCPYLQGGSLPALTLWQMELVFNSLYRPEKKVESLEKFYAVRAFCPCPSMEKERYPTNGQNYFPGTVFTQTAIIFQNDSCLALEKNRKGNYNSGVFTFHNYIQFNDGPHSVTLDSLFTGEQWRVVIANETMNYLNTHPGIRADCSNPAMYSRIFNELFLLGKDGITFYPAWGDKYGRIFFTIPWSLLQPYLKQDIANKLNLN
jgi:hypothetical protein